MSEVSLGLTNIRLVLEKIWIELMSQNGVARSDGAEKIREYYDQIENNHKLWEAKRKLREM